MLDHFAVRLQLGATTATHVVLAASTWSLALLAHHAHTRAATVPEWAPTAAAHTARLRTLTTATAASALLLWAQWVAFWRPALSTGGATLLTPLTVALVAVLARAAWMRRSTAGSPGWVPAALSAVSGTCTLLALAWLASPTGTVISEDTLQSSIFAAFTSSAGWARVLHGSLAATALGALAVAARMVRSDTLPGRRAAVVLALGALLATPVAGLVSTRSVAAHEPVKLAAIAAHWETQASAPLQVGTWAFDWGEFNRGGVAIDGGLSLLAKGDSRAPVQGLLDTPMEGRPPVAGLYWMHHFMVVFGLLALAATAGAAVKPERRGGVLRFVALPAALMASWAGWFIAEVGRQPWTIRGALRVGDAISAPYGIAPVAVVVVVASAAVGVWARRASP